MDENMVPMSEVEEALNQIVKKAIQQWNKYHHSYDRLWNSSTSSTVENLTVEASYLEFARIQLIVTMDIYSDLLGHEYMGKIPQSFLDSNNDQT